MKILRKFVLGNTLCRMRGHRPTVVSADTNGNVTTVLGRCMVCGEERRSEIEMRIMKLPPGLLDNMRSAMAELACPCSRCAAERAKRGDVEPEPFFKEPQKGKIWH